MAPKNTDTETHTIERTAEYDQFIEKLTEYHKGRGTNFEPEPKIGYCHVDLFRLFNHVVENGGYDKISAEKLAWRKVTEELHIPAGNIAQTSFQVKSCFYKYLAAYEITTIHKKEPPPKELLEDVSAKGGSLLTRTWDNNPFKPPGPDAGTDQSGDDSTPGRERPASTNTSSARASRGLREAPPQRVLFQPDTGSTRTRHSSSTHHSNSHAQSKDANTAGSGATDVSGGGQGSSFALNHHSNSIPISYTSSHAHPSNSHHAGPQPPLSRGASASYQPPDSENTSAAVSTYEPRPNPPVALLPVNTPSNNPSEFVKRKHLRALRALPYDPTQSQPPRPMHRYEGPNIYLRCLWALRSGERAEQAFALTHLVRISFERGDKYRFDSFQGLSDGLIEKALEIGSIFYDVNWTVCYNPEECRTEVSKLDGINGTKDILERIAILHPRPVCDDVQPVDEQDIVTMATESTLTIRNMVSMLENAAYMADCMSLRDLLCIILNLPSLEILVEVKHYALDIAEAIVPFLVLGPEDPMYMSIVAQLQSSDRGMILTALRTLARISMNLDATNTLGGIPPKTLRSITSWLLLNDEDLVDACLDFFYQYTAVVSNVESLLESIEPETLITQLVRLLAHGAKRCSRSYELGPAVSKPARPDIAPMPRDLVKRLLALEEPQRCQSWLRGFFEDDPNSITTQMTVWSAYTDAFSDAVKHSGRQMISPPDFIRHVSTVFPSAQAQILKETTGNRFVIRGIRPRPRPVGPDGRTYYPCQWTSSGHPRAYLCGESFCHPEDMYKHIVSAHLPTKEAQNGVVEPDPSKPAACGWRMCPKAAHRQKQEDYRSVVQHVKVHTANRPPPSPQQDGSRSSSMSGMTPTSTTNTANTTTATTNTTAAATRSYVEPAKFLCVTNEQTAAMPDEKGERGISAAGVPLSASLVLCNVARNATKTKSDEDVGGWNERLFRPVVQRLGEVLTQNQLLAPYVGRLLAIADLSLE